MSRLFRVALAFCLSLAVLAPARAADAPDGKPNTYRVRIDPETARAHVEADLWQTSGVLAMFNVMAVDGLPNGQADLVDGLRATDADGKPVALKNLGEGDFEVQGGRRLHLAYDVKLEHDRYAWPAGRKRWAIAPRKA